MNHQLWDLVAFEIEMHITAVLVSFGCPESSRSIQIIVIPCVTVTTNRFVPQLLCPR